MEPAASDRGWSGFRFNARASASMVRMCKSADFFHVPLQSSSIPRNTGVKPEIRNDGKEIADLHMRTIEASPSH